MKGLLLTLLFCHVLFLQSFASHHWSRHGSKHHRLAKATPLKRDAATIDTIRERRVSDIIGGLIDSKADISAWLSSLGPDGKWPDSEVDYTTGCAARRANWPAQVHWLRILSMSAAWHGGLPGNDQFIKNQNLRDGISRAMDYWFGRDLTNLACLNQGGTSSCPCDNPGNLLWNTNWFSNIILIPDLVGQTSIVLGDTLSSSQLNHSTYMLSRSYTFTGMSLTGANALDIARLGMDQALLTGNSTLLADAYGRSHAELIIQNAERADGIRADGAFGQHDGMIYNGNYGKDYSNDVMGNELEAAGTEFTASPDSRAAFETLFTGNHWMIFGNSVTGVLHWDFSVLGRFITFPVADEQPTRNINTNLTAVGELGRQWNSKPMIDFKVSLSGSISNANAGSLQGNRMFFTNDYMVHRGKNYVSTLKMWSKRTRNSECTNSQNPFSFHLADGASYTYVKGDEYEDIFPAWDWDLIPGTTVDYGNTPLTCQNSHLLGVESFVGGVSAPDGSVGLAAMQYTNPVTHALSWKKAWFFLKDDVQHVMVSSLTSESDASVRSVLDQRRERGQVFVNGEAVSSASGSSTYLGCETLWHDDVGYKINKAALTVQRESKTGDWANIGTSTQPPVTVDLFAAFIEHGNGSLAQAVEYSVFPGVDQKAFAAKSASYAIQSVRNDGAVSAVFDQTYEMLMAVFWGVSGSEVTFFPQGSDPVTVGVDANAAVIYGLKTGEVTVSDPSQSLSKVSVMVTRGGKVQMLNFELPGGGLAGSGVTQTVQM